MLEPALPVSVADLTGPGGLADALVALNNADAAALSWLDAERLRQLVGQAFLVRRIGRATGLLLAFDQDAQYRSPNFLWFKAAYRQFVYVDRVVVAADARGRGLARAMYRDVFDHAARAGHDRVVCEVNTDPPNPVSDAFHARLGFTKVGAAVLPAAGKRVGYLSRQLAG